MEFFLGYHIRVKKHSIEIKPYFVAKGKRAQDYFKLKAHNSQIQGADGHIYYERKNVKAPVNWSSNAIDIAASKYFRKSVKTENSIVALVERLCAGLKTAANQSGLFGSPAQVSIFLEEVKYILYSQRAAFNSPVWFNLGLKEQYGLSSDSHYFAWDYKAKKVNQIRDAYLRPQTSACFIQSIDDNLESILDLLKSEAKLFKYGSGSGTNFSVLRSKDEALESGGTSSGLISFLDIFDKAAGAIKSGGTTRRAAKMVTLDLDHPEVEDYINWKWKEEKKARVLIQAGYSADLDGEAYKSVSGQNANNSLRVPDRFMKSLGQNKKWKLTSRINQKTLKEVSVDDLWKQICEAAWNCADPGLQFDDTINAYNTCIATDRIKASNPCSEYMFLDNSACNLASLNLVQFLDENQNFNIEDFNHTVKVIFMAQECLVDFSGYPTEKIAQNAHDYRTLGMGFANLGSFFMRKALAYDSDEARAWAGFISSLMSGVAYQTSAQMAQKIGPFAGFKNNKKSMLSVLKKHQVALKKIDWKFLPSEFKNQAVNCWTQALSLGERHGLRNAQATAIAPTGTIGLVMDCDTTGIEPDFSLMKSKKLSGGGYLKIVNHAVEPALQKLKYSKTEIEKILKSIEDTGSVLNSGLKKEHHSIFACATGDLSLSVDAHLKMMAAVQPFISGAISKTVNLPNSATIQDVGDAYYKAWKLGLKSIALYRDGSKFVQPLSSAEKKTPEVLKCTECGYPTILESGCYRCTNCGTTTACTS